jgi:hypothetical protein
MLNATIDAQLGDAVLCAARGEPIQTLMPEIGERAEKFVQSVDEHADREQWLTVLAFTLERVNGLADYLYAGVFKHRLMSGHRKDVNAFVIEHLGDLGSGLAAYKNDRGGSREVLRIGTDLLRGNFTQVHHYAERHNQPLTLPGKQIAAGVRLVQLRNIGFNRSVARILHDGEESTLPKIVAIRAAAEATRYPKLFVNAAALTQRAAARWDRAFAMLLRARFRI